MSEVMGTTGGRRSEKVLATWFPEVGAGGFTALDGSIEFYGRVQALLRPEMRVLDFGAGRGAALRDDPVGFRRELRTLKGKVARVVACDVDEAVLTNPGADEALTIVLDAPLPFADASFDLIISDFVFEHIANPALVCGELRRILKPGGWLCARTPNKYGLISLAARLIHNAGHAGILRWVQPQRHEIDVFPTVYRLNSMHDLRAWFPPGAFEHFTYRYEPEPGYFFNSRFMLHLMVFVNWLLPPFMKGNLFVFLRKR